MYLKLFCRFLVCLYGCDAWMKLLVE